MSGTAAALRRVLPVVLFALLPLVAVAWMFDVALTKGPLTFDFLNELYPQASALLSGDNPYPHAIWPPLAATLAMPFTVLSVKAAGVAVALAGLACIALSLRLVGVRDWRVFGVVFLWPPVLTDIRIAHLTPLLCLLAAVVWRYRDRPRVAGLGLGLAVGLKFLLWPVGIWLLATRRVRAAWLAAAVGACSLLVVTVFVSVDDYARRLHAVSETFDQDGYSPYGFLVRVGIADTAALLVTWTLGMLLLIATWRRGSFALAIAAALVLSPIVWLDFYALAAVPLAIARPTLSAVWLLPLLTWGLPSSGIATDAVWGVGRVLLVFALVFAVASRDEPAGRDIRPRW
jgi:hypothetical protein